MPWGDLPRGEFSGSGLLVVDKDAGVTSHDVVAAVRRLAGTRKAGHAGTLDPMATGVLCVGVGRATKLLRYVTGADKEYTATVRLGVETSTEDADGRVTAARGAAGVRVEAVDRAIAALTGVVGLPPALAAQETPPGAAAPATGSSALPSLLPRPVSYQAAAGEAFTLTPDSVVLATGEAAVAVAEVVDELRTSTGYALPVLDPADAGQGTALGITAVVSP